MCSDQKQKMNNISIVIPTYNRLSTLKKVIDSYVNQNGVKEIIIIDDYSSDHTEEYFSQISKKYKQIKYLRNKENMGAPYSRNRAIDVAKGEYVFMGEDDLYLPNNFLNTLYKHMVSSKADVIAGRRIWLGENESFIDGLTRANKSTGNPFIKKTLTTNCEIKLDKDTELPLVDASMLISRKVFEKIKYDEHYRKNAWREETDYQISAEEKGFKIVYCPHIESYHLFKKKNTGGNHNHNLINYEKTIWINNLYMFNKHKKYLKEKFGINYIFIIRFIYYRISRLLMNELISFKKRLFGSKLNY